MVIMIAILFCFKTEKTLIILILRKIEIFLKCHKINNWKQKTLASILMINLKVLFLVSIYNLLKEKIMAFNNFKSKCFQLKT